MVGNINLILGIVKRFYSNYMWVPSQVVEELRWVDKEEEEEVEQLHYYFNSEFIEQRGLYKEDDKDNKDNK